MISGRPLLRPCCTRFSPGPSLRRSLLPKAARLILLLFPIVPVALAQGTGNISGYVRDSSSAVLPGTSVTAVMTEQSTTRKTLTDAQGFYSFLALPSGHYTITFEAKGFQRQVRSNVELTVAQNARVDSVLAV